MNGYWHPDRAPALQTELLRRSATPDRKHRVRHPGTPTSRVLAAGPSLHTIATTGGNGCSLFTALVDKLSADQAAPFWRAAQAEAAARCDMV